MRPKVNFQPEAWIKISELKEHPRNPRIDLKQNPKKFELLKQSIQGGVFEPIKVSRSTGYCLAGNQRLKAFADLGYEEVPVQYNDCFDEHEEVEIMIKDNNEWGEYDYDGLDSLLKDFTFDMDSLAFNQTDLDQLKALQPKVVGGGDDDVPEPPATPKSKLGDFFQLGKHKLLCGDCTDLEQVQRLLGDEKANVLITDPPYGVNYSDKNNAMGSFRPNKNKHIDIQNDVEGDLEVFFTNVLKNLEGTFDNTFYIFMSNQELHNLRKAIDNCEWKWSDYLVWNKQHFVLGRKDYNAKHEFIVYGWQKKHKFFGKNNSTTVIDFDRPMSSKEHPTMKPVGLIEQLICDGTLENNIVLDVFGGSGTTLIACENKNRCCRMMELEPKYVDVIIERWEKLTGERAVKL